MSDDPNQEPTSHDASADRINELREQLEQARARFKDVRAKLDTAQARARDLHSKLEAERKLRRELEIHSAYFEGRSMRLSVLETEDC